MPLSPLIRFGTSTWTYEGWQGQVYVKKYAKTTFARECLGEYCQYLHNGEPCFRTVGNDSTFYRPPTANQLRHYLNQIPEDFEMCFKVWEEITVPLWEKQARYGVKAGQPNPLMQLAAARGKFLEGMVASVAPLPGIDDAAEAAFMTGIFSLLDTLLHLPMAEVLAAVPLAAPIAAALATTDGALGQMLKAVLDGDAGRHEAAAGTLKALGISPETHLAAQDGAYTWASRITLE